MKYVLLFFLLFSLPVLGQTRGSLSLSGFIPLLFDIRIQPSVDNIGNINLEDGETNLKVADVLEASNSTAGYTISLQSTNAGNLLHNNGTDSVPYQIQYGATGTLTTPGAIGTPTLVKSSGPLIGLTFTIEEVFFTTPASTGLVGGAYTDTLIISIEGI